MDAFSTEMSHQRSPYLPLLCDKGSYHVIMLRKAALCSGLTHSEHFELVSSVLL